MSFGSGMDFQDARSYVQANLGGSVKNGIIYLNPDNISWYRNNGYMSIGGGSHAVIVQGTDGNGGYIIYDPSLNKTFSISSDESKADNGTYWTW